LYRNRIVRARNSTEFHGTEIYLRINRRGRYTFFVKTVKFEMTGDPSDERSVFRLITFVSSDGRNNNNNNVMGTYRAGRTTSFARARRSRDNSLVREREMKRIQDRGRWESRPPRVAGKRLGFKLARVFRFRGERFPIRTGDFLGRKCLSSATFRIPRNRPSPNRLRAGTSLLVHEARFFFETWPRSIERTNTRLMYRTPRFV